MCRYPLRKAVFATLLLALSPLLPARAQKLDQLVPRNVALKQMIYQGRSAVQLIADADADNGSSYAMVKDTCFLDGTIEVNVAGKPAAGAGPEARGFIGIAFRLRDNKYEYIYLRPTNGRADNQVRRIIPHSTVHIRNSTSPACGRNHRRCTSPTWICSPACGQNT